MYDYGNPPEGENPKNIIHKTSSLRSVTKLSDCSIYIGGLEHPSTG